MRAIFISLADTGVAFLSPPVEEIQNIPIEVAGEEKELEVGLVNFHTFHTIFDAAILRGIFTNRLTGTCDKQL